MAGVWLPDRNRIKEIILTMHYSYAMPRVKVCCIASPEEAWMAIRHGASALGLVSAMPSGPGVVSWDDIEHIAGVIPPGIASFLLTSSQDADEIIEQQRRVKTTTVQIVDELTRGGYQDLRRALPGIGIVQVIHVTGEHSVSEAMRIAPRVDALLLDSGNPQATVKTLGGTGAIHNWQLSRRIVQGSPSPVYLAGGLKPENAGQAVTQVKPFGLDLCSGIRSDGQLDEERLMAFMSSVAVGCESRHAATS